MRFFPEMFSFRSLFFFLSPTCTLYANIIRVSYTLTAYTTVDLSLSLARVFFQLDTYSVHSYDAARMFSMIVSEQVVWSTLSYEIKYENAIRQSQTENRYDGIHANRCYVDG